MKNFVFTIKGEEPRRAVMKTDTVDKHTQLFTIMYFDGVQETEFEKHIPWKLGQVLSYEEIKAWALELQPLLTVVAYEGDDEPETLGVDEFTLTITPDITSEEELEEGETAEVIVILTTENKYGKIDKPIVLKGETDVTVNIVEGFEYSFSLTNGLEWTVSAPEDFTCSANKSVTLAVTIPTEEEGDEG